MSKAIETEDELRNAWQGERDAAVAALVARQESELAELLSQVHAARERPAPDAKPDPDALKREVERVLEQARHVEQMQHRHAEARRASETLEHSWTEFLRRNQQHESYGVLAQTLLQREQSAAPGSIDGERVQDAWPSVLDGLKHDVKSRDHVVYSRGEGEKVTSVVTDLGDRLDVHRIDAQDIEASLRLAQLKYDMEKGLKLSGTPEFREQAARIAGRLNLKIQDQDLQTLWKEARAAAVAIQTPAMVRTEPTPAPSHDAPGQVAGDILDDGMAAATVLNRLSRRGRHALHLAAMGKDLTDTQRELLEKSWSGPLIDSEGQLTQLGRIAHKRYSDGLLAGQAVEQARTQAVEAAQQQQLTARNVAEREEANEALARANEHMREIREEVFDEQALASARQHELDDAVEQQLADDSRTARQVTFGDGRQSPNDRSIGL